MADFIPYVLYRQYFITTCLKPPPPPERVMPVVLLILWVVQKNYIAAKRCKSRKYANLQKKQEGNAQYFILISASKKEKAARDCYLFKIF